MTMVRLGVLVILCAGEPCVGEPCVGESATPPQNLIGRASGVLAIEVTLRLVLADLATA